MDGKNVTELTEVSEISDTDNLLIGVSNTLKRITFANVKTLLKTIIGEATTALSGLFSAEDKTKLDAIDSSLESKTVETSISDDDAVIPTGSAVSDALADYTADADTLSSLDTTSSKPVNSSAVSGALSDYYKLLKYSVSFELVLSSGETTDFETFVTSNINNWDNGEMVILTNGTQKARIEIDKINSNNFNLMYQTFYLGMPLYIRYYGSKFHYFMFSSVSW